MNLKAYIYLFCLLCLLHSADAICAENDYVLSASANNLQFCSEIIQEKPSIVSVWFTIGFNLTQHFGYFCFTLVTISVASGNKETMESNFHRVNITDYTELTDTNNSLTIKELNPGQHEICVQFLDRVTMFIYVPRDGCLRIQVGIIPPSFKQDSTSQFIILTGTIVLFFIMGLLVQNHKSRRDRKQHELEFDDETDTRTRSYTNASTLSKRTNFLKNLFHKHIDQPELTKVQLWAKSRYRHRLSADISPQRELNNTRSRKHHRSHQVNIPTISDGQHSTSLSSRYSIESESDNKNRITFAPLSPITEFENESERV
ncbi:unnamed protein product [Didymodactylos carnosus]|uniref:Uncharacterized protein n=1 Tax=Didymodactylos carnosus TaxID=1234261 RepID=A0A813WDD6_9BILA|nr:unnamed protein product [Didymodactylos carnosus]CAF1360464.1 unnamed protein product [Didymodactylos carnosus]CAF3637326.1 unnamed protein product [Didymodactylos carnosus]CAF4170627.1 unnamed protein product [Didymodactylos carnosus]